MENTNSIIINGFPHKYYSGLNYPASEASKRSRDFFQSMALRRSVREYSTQEISKETIENIVKTAASAPSGAHKQPWTFCCISNSDIKKRIRKAAEEEEYESYNNRMSQRWLDDLKPIGTDWKKPFLEHAPWLIVVFKKVYDTDNEGNKSNNYYVNESVGIACGMLIAAIHMAGLVTLTHTPSPMNFLSSILNRPENERPYLLLPVGYPSPTATVPDFQRKPLEQIATFV